MADCTTKRKSGTPGVATGHRSAWSCDLWVAVLFPAKIQVRREAGIPSEVKRCIARRAFLYARARRFVEQRATVDTWRGSQTDEVTVSPAEGVAVDEKDKWCWTG